MRHQAVVTDIISATSRTDAGALRPNSLPNLTTDNCCRDRDAGQLTRDAGQLTTCPMLTNVDFYRLFVAIEKSRCDEK